MAVLIQTYEVHLRTRKLPRGTPYQLDCAGPLIVQLPIDASNVTANATDAAGLQTALPVQAPVAAVPLAFGRSCEPSHEHASRSLESQSSRRATTASSSASFFPRPAHFGRRSSTRLRSRAAARSTSSRSGRWSRRWRKCRRSRSSRRRSRPASPHRTSSGGSAATARRRARSHAHAKRALEQQPGSPGRSSPGSCRSPAIAG